jgi:hypothetical protein
MESNIEIIDKTNEDQDLEFTKSVRKKLINSLTKDCTKMPEDVKDQSILLQALDGMDRMSIAKKKIKSDEGISDKQLIAAETISQIFKTKDIRQIHRSDEIGEIKLLEAGVVDVVILEGELEDTPRSNNYESFMAKYQRVD